MTGDLQVLAVAGSLRAASINAAFCRAAARLAGVHLQDRLQVQVFGGLGELPPFNPDLETDPPAAVRHWREQVDRADALLIASPEYAHGVSGVMKNALDWLVSFEGFVHKPVAVVNTSPRAHHACDALLETLRTMSATIVADASVTLPLLGSPCTTEEAMVHSPTVAPMITAAMSSLAAFLRRGEAADPRFTFGS